MVDFDKKFKNSPYDSAGMPLGAATVDYDKKDDVAQHSVKDKYIEPLPLFSDSDEFQEKHIERRVSDPAKFNSAIELPIRDEDQPEKEKPEENKEEDNSNPDDLLALLKETDNDGK